VGGRLRRRAAEQLSAQPPRQLAELVEAVVTQLPIKLAETGPGFESLGRDRGNYGAEKDA